MSCFRLSLAVCLLLGSAGLLRAEQSATARAEELLARSQREFAEGRYADAIETLRSGYVLAPQARFLYALGQAYRLNHQCKEAVKAYRSFIRSEPSKTQLAAAEANINRCGDEDPSSLKEPSPPRSQPSELAEAQPTSAPAAVIVATPPPPSKPVYKRWWPWTIMTVALVGVGVGVGLGLGLHKNGSSFATTLPEVGPNAQR
jgi:tetratricopeptide (TPR) repeat protein